MLSKKARIALQVANIASFVAAFVINVLANVVPYNNKTTQELSDAIPNLFVPAGITFSIWGVIYILSFVFSFYQGKSLFTKELPAEGDRDIVERIHVFWILANVFNGAWMFTWHYELVEVSLALIIGLFASLLLLYLRLGIGARGREDVTLKERLLAHLPISVYLGWLTVATIANLTAVLVVNRPAGQESLLGIPDATWTVLVLIVGAAITGLVLFTRKDVAYSLVVIWTYAGIILKRVDPAFSPELAIVVTALIAIIAIAAVATVAAIALVKNRQRAKAGGGTEKTVATA